MKIRKKIKVLIGSLALGLCSILFGVSSYASSELNGLVTYNAITAYYSSSVVYYSQDNGQTYQSAMSQGVSTSVSNGNLKIDKSSPWGSSYIYFVRIDFTNAFGLKKISFYGANRPNPSNIKVNDILFNDWKYTIIDSVSYLYVDNIYQFTNEVYIYFTIDGYTNGGSRDFEILVGGVQTSFEAYQSGYNDGYSNGYDDGYSNGEDYGEMIGYENGKNDGYDIGYDSGFEDGEQSNFTTNGFKTLIGSIFNYPINMVKTIFDFEFMGINVASIIMFVLSIGIVVFVIKKFRG